jgi:c(7)-type cytochrome triheme protein
VIRGALLAVALGAAFEIQGPVSEYGRVVLDRRASHAGVPPVAFDHTLHRARFTCRVCHVDVGFAMSRGATGISAATNRGGFHCGACHDGKRQFEGKPIFPACSPARSTAPYKACKRCHGGRDEKELADEFAALQLPRGRFGEVDWEQAEQLGKVHPSDALEGVSIARPALKMDREVSLQSHGAWMADVRFSHKRHAVWNGCEVCHPEIFPSTKAGTVKFSMLDLADGQYCGVCHGKVAFALAYCEKCHEKPVELH